MTAKGTNRGVAKRAAKAAKKAERLGATSEQRRQRDFDRMIARLAR